LKKARENRRIEYEAETHSDLGRLFFEMGRPGEATSHIVSSNVIAEENSLNSILLDNHLLLSQMERSRGRWESALRHMERYHGLRDSLYNADKFANISQLQRVSEVSKANRRIETMAVEQKVKERTINYQKFILIVAFGALLVLAAILSYVFSQKRKLNKAYRTLFEKNIKIMELEHDAPQQPSRQTPQYDTDGELLRKILAVMDETEVICNPHFSINMLAAHVGANHNYVSQVINATQNKNFRSFLNEYRIREAQKLFSEADTAKYTIEAISLRLGYKSQNTFRAAFAEITGIGPGFYLKSIREAPEK
jgi:AraC-like DNA-binding protein